MLEIVHPPFLASEQFNQFLESYGFTAPEQDTETHFPYYGQGRLCKGAILGELTLANYDDVFSRMVNMYDMLNWGKISKRLDWLHKIFKRVYDGEKPTPKRKKLF